MTERFKQAKELKTSSDFVGFVANRLELEIQPHYHTGFFITSSSPFITKMDAVFSFLML